MVSFVRVDDRLLHGQIICAWVPFMKADMLIVASDEAASDTLVSDIISSCGYKGLGVQVKSLKDAVDYLAGTAPDEKVILILGDLADAMRVYDLGLRFSSINLGNIHHEANGRRMTPSVIVNDEDISILDRLCSLGIKVEIQDVPASAPREYSPAGKV